MAVALETFVKHLADSGVIAPGKLENFIPPKRLRRMLRNLPGSSSKAAISPNTKLPKFTKAGPSH